MFIWPWIVEYILLGSKFLFLASFYGMVVLFLLWFIINRTKQANPKLEVILTITHVSFIVLFIDGIFQFDSPNWVECKATPAEVQYMEYKYQNYPLNVCRERENIYQEFGMWKIMQGD